MKKIAYLSCAFALSVVSCMQSIPAKLFVHNKSKQTVTIDVYNGRAHKERVEVEPRTLFNKRYREENIHFVLEDGAKELLTKNNTNDVDKGENAYTLRFFLFEDVTDDR